MEAFEITLLLLAAVLLSAIIDQMVPKISSPLIQIALGLVIALFSFAPIELHLDPELFIVLLIAPLLFYEAKTVNKVELWKNKVPVLSLAIGLVFATTMAIGFYVHWLIPSIPLAAAFALGAALGPTDAVAVSSLSKEVSLDKRQKALLEGESLINDASGIVSFQFAIAAVVTGSFALADASLNFLLSFFGGIIIGVVLGFIANFASNKIRSLGLDNTTFHVLLEVFMPFIIYLAAHALGASGILAVVAAGLVVSVSPKEIRPSVSRANIVSNSVWQVLTFALNGLVFVLLGAQLPTVMAATWESGHIDRFELVAYILVVTLMMVLARYLWILAMEFVETRRKKTRRKFNKADFKSALITTLAGPKGAFTLVLMMTVPLTVTTTTGIITFPERSLILFLASGVIIVTLLLATFVVPLLAPKKAASSNDAEDVNAVTIDILRNVIESLVAEQTPETRVATQAVIRSYNERIARLKENSDRETGPNRALRRQVLSWEEDFVSGLIAKGEVSPALGKQFLDNLDHQRTFMSRHDKGLSLRSNLRRVFSGFARFGRLVTRGVRHLVDRKQDRHPEELRDLQIRTIQYVIDRLQEEMGSSDTPTEDVSTLLFDYQMILRRLRNARGDRGEGDQGNVSTFTRNVSKMTDVRHSGLLFELEQIQAMYEADRISRATAKTMRENVNLMQLDLDQSI